MQLLGVAFLRQNKCSISPVNRYSCYTESIFNIKNTDDKPINRAIEFITIFHSEVGYQRCARILDVYVCTIRKWRRYSGEVLITALLGI